MELCRYIVLNPVRAKGKVPTGSWRWSSYRATAGLASVPEFLTPDWVLGQFGKKRAQAQKRYREFVREGVKSRPWEELKGQIYLGSEAFIEKHSPKDRERKAQLQIEVLQYDISVLEIRLLFIFLSSVK